MDFTILTVIIYLILQMLIVWGIASLIKNPSIVDVFWSVGLTVSGLIYLFSNDLNQRIILISLILIIWGSRLAGYLLLSRILQNKTDKRYSELSENFKIKKPLGFLLNFQLQGLFIFIISFSFYFIAKEPNLEFNYVDYIAILFCFVGVFGETLADKQLTYFKKQKTGTVCNIGLWNYTRHPNYFFDWLTWCGFMVFALRTEYGFIAIVSPLTLYLIMTKITGPMTEDGSIKSKGEAYLTYQKNTNMFFPWLNKGI